MLLGYGHSLLLDLLSFIVQLSIERKHLGGDRLVLIESMLQLVSFAREGIAKCDPVLPFSLGRKADLLVELLDPRAILPLIKTGWCTLEHSSIAISIIKDMSLLQLTLAFTA
jgi:hypothetical protein